MNKISKVVVLSSSKAERIGTTDKMSIIIRAAAIDIENNLLPMQSLKVFVDEELVDKSISDETGELTLMIQREYKPSSEVLVQIEHEASKIKSRSKILTIGEEEGIVAHTKDEKELNKLEVITHIKENGLLLGEEKYIEFNDDYIVVWTAVKQNGKALKFASDRLKNDISIVDEALCQSADYIYLAGEKQQKNYIDQVKNTINKLEREKWIQYNDINDKFRDNFEKGKSVFHSIPGTLISNKEIILKALNVYSYYIYHQIPKNILEQILTDKDFILKAMAICKTTYVFLSKDLQEDPTIKQQLKNNI